MHNSRKTNNNKYTIRRIQNDVEEKKIKFGTLMFCVCVCVLLMLMVENSVMLMKIGMSCRRFWLAHIIEKLFNI